MIRKDREITDFDKIIEIMSKCDVCRIAINNGDYPYIVPLNFGMKVDGGKIKLYFHSASEGTKLDLIAKDSRVSFEMDRGHQLVLIEEEKNCTMNYESVIGRGTIKILPEEEKLEALEAIMHHYRADTFGVNKTIIGMTTVMELDVEEVTAKARKKK